MTGTDRIDVQPSDDPLGTRSYSRRRREERWGSAEPYQQLAAKYSAAIGNCIDANDGNQFDAEKVVAVLLYRAALQEPYLSYEGLYRHLKTHPRVAVLLGFETGELPSADSIRYWWTQKCSELDQRIIEFRAQADIAEYIADRYGEDLPGAASLRTRHHADDSGEQAEDESDIPEKRRLEESVRDQAFNRFKDIFHDVLDYGRASNAEKDSEELTDLGTFISRRNETVTGGRDVYVRENEVADGDYMSAETLASPIRDFSRRLAERRHMENHAYVPDGEDQYDWKLDPEDRDFGEGESWHKRTERGIEEMVEMLQSRGMLDRPVDICLDGTARDYHNRNDTECDKPDGVHYRHGKFRTGYGWEDITVTAIYRGRAIVLGSFSYVPDNSHFQAVRYLIDRVRDLVNVRNVYADSEFATQKICSYITHCGLDYVMAKRETSAVTDEVEQNVSGAAGFTDYEIEGGDHTKHKTTLLALEKRTNHPGEERNSSGDGDDAGDGRRQSTLGEVGGEKTEDVDGPISAEDVDMDAEEKGDLLSYAEVADTDKDYDHAVFMTSLDIDSVGMDPRSNPVGHDASETAWGAGQLYRKRWSIETAFRDLKRNFNAKPRSRCLGVRRFFFMLCILLYNAWVCTNLIVADEVEHRDPDEIVWRKKIFVIDLYNEVFSDLEYG